MLNLESHPTIWRMEHHSLT